MEQIFNVEVPEDMEAAVIIVPKGYMDIAFYYTREALTNKVKESKRQEMELQIAPQIEKEVSKIKAFDQKGAEIKTLQERAEVKNKAFVKK